MSQKLWKFSLFNNEACQKLNNFKIVLSVSESLIVTGMN